MLYKIYRGRVKSISEAGAFILLEGIAGGVEGQLVRSEIPMNVHLRRDGVVFVKVIAVTKMTIRLNMKDADQRTGKDLNPNSARIGAAAARMLDVTKTALFLFLFFFLASSTLTNNNHSCNYIYI